MIIKEKLNIMFNKTAVSKDVKFMVKTVILSFLKEENYMGKIVANDANIMPENINELISKWTVLEKVSNSVKIKTLPIYLQSKVFISMFSL